MGDFMNGRFCRTVQYCPVKHATGMFYDGQLLCLIKVVGLPKRQSLFGKEEAPAERVKHFLIGNASKAAVGKDKVGGCR